MPDECLSSLAFIFQPNKSPKYHSVQLNTRTESCIGMGMVVLPRPWYRSNTAVMVLDFMMDTAVIAGMGTEQTSGNPSSTSATATTTSTAVSGVEDSMYCCSGDEHNAHLHVNIGIVEVRHKNRRRRQGSIQRT